MIITSQEVLDRWKTGNFPLRNRAEIFFPTPVVSAAGSTEYSSNFPASAIMDGDRTTLNAGPFDREEAGYGPADNLIGKGLWMGKHVVHDPIFRLEGNKSWLGQAWYSSDYYDELALVTDPLGNPDYPNPHMMGHWRLDDKHKDDQPTASQGGSWDVLVDSSMYANHGIYIMDNGAGLSTTARWANHHLGQEGLLTGENAASAFFDGANWYFTPTPSSALLDRGVSNRINEYDRGRNTLNFWVRFTTGSGGPIFTQYGSGTIPGIPGVKIKAHTILVGTNYVSASIGSPTFGYTIINTLNPAQGGQGIPLPMNDGNPHMVTVIMGKQQGGYWLWEIYVDGEQRAARIVSGGFSPAPFPADSLIYVGGGTADNFTYGCVQAGSWHNWPWYGIDQPDYAPGLVAYNQVKYMWQRGINGIYHPAPVVPPTFNGTTVVGDLLQPDFTGGTSHASGFDEAWNPQQFQLYDTAWAPIPMGSYPQTPRQDADMFMIAQSDVLPPGKAGKSLKIFSKPAPWIGYYGLKEPPYGDFTKGANWGRAITPTTQGKMVVSAMVHRQNVNPGNNAGHFMIEAWEGTATVNKGFKVVFNEVTHNFHISMNPDPFSDNYHLFIYAADGVNTGVPWTYDTWYNIVVEFNVTAGLVRLFVNGTLIGSIAGLVLTTGLDNLRLWYKGDERRPLSYFGGSQPLFDAQYWTYGNMIYYIDDLRIGNGCYTDPASYEAVFELGGFPVGNAEFAFEAESVTISDPPFTYTPYWSFELAYGDSPTGPWSAWDPVFPNPGKVSSASAVVFNPQGAPYVKIRATHNADGGACLGSAGLKFAELKFGQLATGLTLGTDGKPVGRIIIYTDPEVGGISQFKFQKGTTGGDFHDIVGADIERMTAYYSTVMLTGGVKGDLAATQIDADGTLHVWSHGIPGANAPSIIVVDLKKNFSDEDAPAYNKLRILILESGTPDDRPRCAEVELFNRIDMTSLTVSMDITHQADVTFQNIDARIAQLEVKNPRKRNDEFTFTKEMFQRATSGQTAIDGTAEVVIWQSVERDDEWKQLGWFSVDDPGITHEAGTLMMALRGRNERLLIEKYPAAWKEGWTYGESMRYLMALCNVPEGFYAASQYGLGYPGVPVLAPIRTAWEEVTDMKQVIDNPGIFFDGHGIFKDSPSAPIAVQDTIDRAGFFHRFTEHVAHALAGIPMAIHAVEVDVFSVLTLPDQLLFTEAVTTAGVAERIIQLAEPSDPLSLFNAYSPLQITRAHPKYPKIANTQPGAIIRGKVKRTSTVKELVVSGLTAADDPNRTVKRSISNEYVITKAQAQTIASREIDEMAKATNWAESEWPSSPHVEIGDVFHLEMARRGVSQDYIVKRVNHQVRAESGGGLARTILEVKEINIP